MAAAEGGGEEEVAEVAEAAEAAEVAEVAEVAAGRAAGEDTHRAARPDR
jgi:hypothetical protein